MKVHVLVEGPSEEAFLGGWVHRYVGPDVTVRIYPHQGKGSLPTDPLAQPAPHLRGLLDQLPAKLRAFARSGEPVLVLVDADDDDCKLLKNAIAQIANTAAPGLMVVVRIACEETEAFFLGDQKALRLAYPDADMNIVRRYSQDSVSGTWEVLGQAIGDDGANKRAWAERIGRVLSTEPSQNMSPSFRQLCKGLDRIAAQPAEPRPKKKAYRHVAKSRRQ